jgi:hypothetical protein
MIDIQKTFIACAVLFIGSFLLPRSIGYAQEPAKPAWVETLKQPTRPGQKCFIGKSQSLSDSNQALAEAYKNALFNVIEREFPDLISISSQSSERLEGSTYSRDTAYKSENVQFNGLTEDKESPYLEKNEKSLFIASRMLCWSDAQLLAERVRQAEIKRGLSPLITNRSESLLPSNAKPGPTGELEVVTVPSGASILLASSPIGTSNSTFGKVIEGNYELVIQKDGYEIETRTVTIIAGQRKTEKFELRRHQSKITINSEPPGALVYLNNKPQDGKTPFTATTTVGEEVEIRVELDDYFTEKRTLTATHRPSTEVFNLRPQDATLSILSTPPGADVFANGEFLAKTNAMGKKLPGGKYHLEFKMDGFEIHSEHIEIWKSKPYTAKPTLKVKTEERTSSSSKATESRNEHQPTDFSPFFRFMKRTLIASSAMFSGAATYYLFSHPRVDEEATSLQREAAYPPGKEICEYYNRACDRYLIAAGAGLVGTIATAYTAANMDTELIMTKDEEFFFFGIFTLALNGWALAALYENVQAAKAAKLKYDQASKAEDAEKFRSFIKRHREDVDTYFPISSGLTILGLYWTF